MARDFVKVGGITVRPLLKALGPGVRSPVLHFTKGLWSTVSLRCGSARIIKSWSVLHVLQFLCCARFPALRALSTTGSSTKLKMGWSYGMLGRDTMLTSTCSAVGVDQNHLQAQWWVGLRQALEVNPASKISKERLFVNRIWWPDALGSDHTFGAWKMQDRPFWRDGEPFSMHLLTFR